MVAGTSLGITAPPGFPSLTTLNVGGEVRLLRLVALPCDSVLFCFVSLAAAPGRMARDAARLMVEAPSQCQALCCAALCWVDSTHARVLVCAAQQAQLPEHIVLPWLWCRAAPGWVECHVSVPPPVVLTLAESLRADCLCPLLLRCLQVRRAGVNVFGMASRKESLILQLKVSAGAATGFL